jgi:hypothetical protein
VQIACGTGDAGEQIAIEQEMLAEPVIGAQAKAGDDRAQRLAVGPARLTGGLR